MDYNDQSVGICYFCMFFRYKQYYYLMMTTNTIQGLLLMAIGIFGLSEQFQLLVFQRPIVLSILGLGSSVVLGLILQLILYIRHSVLYIGRIMVQTRKIIQFNLDDCFLFSTIIVNILTSLLDLSSGIILLLSYFMEFSFIEFNDTQKSFSTSQRTILLIISIILIVISLYGFWMTYLQYQTIVPLQEQLEKETQVVPVVEPVVSLRQAVARKLSKNFIGELTPNNNGKVIRLARGDSTSEQSQPLQKIQLKHQNQNQEEQHDHYINQRSDKLIKVPDNMTNYNEYYAPSTNTIRLPQQTDDLQTLRRQKTPRTTYNKQQQEG